MAQAVGKPLISGEIGCLPFSRSVTEVWTATPDYFESYQDVEAALPWIEDLLEEIIASRVQLSHWWAYQSDRAMDQGHPQRMDVSLERDPEIVRAIANANQRLKEALGIGEEELAR